MAKKYRGGVADDTTVRETKNDAVHDSEGAPAIESVTSSNRTTSQCQPHVLVDIYPCALKRNCSDVNIKNILYLFVVKRNVFDNAE